MGRAIIIVNLEFWTYVRGGFTVLGTIRMERHYVHRSIRNQTFETTVSVPLQSSDNSDDEEEPMSH